MVQVSFELSEDVLSSVRKDPESFTRELRLAAAVKWYEIGLVSQSRATEIAGLSRAAFIDALGQFQVSAFQYDVDEIAEEVDREG